MSQDLPQAAEYPRSIEWMGNKVHVASPNEIHDYVKSVIQSGEQAQIVYLNVRGACQAWSHSWLADYYQKAQLVYCDGDGIRWGLNILGKPVPEKVPLTRWLWDLAAFCEQEHASIFLLGAKPDIADLASTKLKEKYPQLKFVGTHHGYYDHSGEENDHVIKQINDSNANVLLVSFGSPEQERWLSENASRLKPNILMTGGGVLDYVSGKLGKAPQWMINCQIEWMFRIYQEPGRLFLRYLVELPTFFLKVIGHRLFGANTK